MIRSCLGAALTLIAAPALACSCMPGEGQSLSQFLEAGGKVIRAEAISQQRTDWDGNPVGDDDFASARIWTVRVTGRLGVETEDVIEITTGHDSAMCGVWIGEGPQILNLSGTAEEGYGINLCAQVALPREVDWDKAFAPPE